MTTAKALCALAAGIIAMAAYSGIVLYKGKKFRFQDPFMAGLSAGGVVTGLFFLVGAFIAAYKHPECQEAAQMGGLGGFAVALISLHKGIDMFKAVWKSKKSKKNIDSGDEEESDEDAEASIPPTT